MINMQKKKFFFFFFNHGLRPGNMALTWYTKTWFCHGTCPKNKVLPWYRSKKTCNFVSWSVSPKHGISMINMQKTQNNTKQNNIMTLSWSTFQNLELHGIKVLAHWVWNFRMRFFIFVILKIHHAQKPCTLSHIISVNSVCKDLYGALCYNMKWMNLTIAILDFGVRLYGGSELSKHLSKCLLRMQKMQKIEPDPNFFMTDESFGGSV